MSFIEQCRIGFTVPREDYRIISQYAAKKKKTMMEIMREWVIPKIEEIRDKGEHLQHLHDDDESG